MSRAGTTTRALLVGIDHYDRPLTTWPPRLDMEGKQIRFKNLEGCVNDVLAMREYLIKTMDIDPSNIETLLAPVPDRKRPFQLPTTEERKLPTYGNLTSALRNLAVISDRGDVVYVHYSGHGACATSVFDKRGDDIDHSLVPYDIAHGGKYVRDVEFGALLQDIVDRGAVVTVVLDSCYSGGALRAGEDEEREEEDGIRAVKGVYASQPVVDLPDNMERVLHWAQKRSWMEAPDGFVVLAACLDNQKAKEMTVHTPDGRTHRQGLLTHWLLDTVRITPAGLAGRTICDRVRAKVAAQVSEQTPYVVGDLDHFIFSKGVRSKVHTLPVRSVDMRSRVLKNRSLCLWSGVMDGVRRLSEYAILPLGFDLGQQFDQSDVLARVRVVSVSSGECRAVFLQPENMTTNHWNKLAAGCPAVLQRLPIDARHRIRFRATDVEQHVQFEQRWKLHVDDASRLHLVQRDGGNHDTSLEVQLDDSGNFLILDAGGDFPPEIANSLDLDALSWDDEDSISRLVSRLDHLARFKTLKGLENPVIRAGGVTEIVSVSVEPADEGFMIADEWGGRHWCAPAEAVKPGKDGAYEVQPLTAFRIRITNNLDKPIGCVVLDFNQQLGVNKVFPRGGLEFKTIEAKASAFAKMGLYIPEQLQEAVDAGFPIVDMFKVLVSLPGRGFGAMALPNMEDIQGDRGSDDSQNDDLSSGLDEFLQQLGPLTRQGGPPVEDDQQGLDWQTVDVRVRLIQETG